MKEFEVDTRTGEVVRTLSRNQSADAARARLAELDLTEEAILDAVAWARDVMRRSDDE